MTDDRVQEAARLLAEGWLAGKTVEGFTQDLRPKTREQAYAIQDEMARIIGQPTVGWKLGWTSRTAKRRPGFEAPNIGRIFASVAYQSPATVEAARFPNAGVEGEFALRLKEDAPPRDRSYEADELREIVTVHLALEIVGTRFPKVPGQPRPPLLDEIADNGAGFGFVFGAEVPGWRDLDLMSIPVELRVDDGPPAEPLLGDDRSQVLEALVDAANILSERGIGLKTGDFVATGLLNMPPPIHAGCRVRVRFEGLGEVAAEFV